MSQDMIRNELRSRIWNELMNIIKTEFRNMIGIPEPIPDPVFNSPGIGSETGPGMDSRT